jgi:hypothetical protein
MTKLVIEHYQKFTANSEIQKITKNIIKFRDKRLAKVDKL